MAFLGIDRARRNRARRAVARVALRTFAPTLVRVLARSWKVHVEGDDLSGSPNGHLVCMWHGRMLIGAPVFADRGYRVLVSTSDDGDLSESLLLSSGYKVLRGSSSRGAARALREMLGHLEQGERVVITPDGPRGPRHSINPGLAWMARRTGFPILPLGLVADRAWRMGTWDRFTIPKPRARVVAIWGEPLRVEPGADRGAIESLSRELRRRTIELEELASERLGVERDW